MFGAIKKGWNKVRKAADTLHLHSVSQQLDFKKLVKNPKGYFTDQVKAYGKDIKFAGTVYSRYKNGSWKSLATEAVGDTAKAFGASKEQQMNLGSIGGLIGEAYSKYKSGDYGKIADAWKAGDYSQVATLASKAGDSLVKASKAGPAKAQKSAVVRAATASMGSTQAALLDSPGAGEKASRAGLSPMMLAGIGAAALAGVLLLRRW